MKETVTSLTVFAWRTTSVHMITYFIAGILAVNLMDYETLFGSGGLEHYMHPTDAPIVALGPAMQLIRGLIFSVVLWPFCQVFLNNRRGWLKLWGLFLGLGIFSTFGPAPGSVDGVIYTQIPMDIQLKVLPELVFQSLLLSLGIWAWYHNPKRIWNYIAGFLLTVILFLSIVGYFALKVQGSL